MKMRKAISAFLAVICIFASFGIRTLGASAEGAETVYATTSASVKQGSYGYLYVYLDDLTDLAALNVAVYYDTEKVTVTNTYNRVPCELYDSAVKDGCVQFSYIFDGAGSQTKTNLFYFQYKVNDTAEVGDTYFDIIVTDAYNSSVEPLPIGGSRCSFSIAEKVTVKTCSVYANASISSSVEEEFEINYRLSTYQIASGSFTVLYDPELFEFVSLTQGGFLDGKITDVNSSFAGSVYVSFVGTEYNTGYDMITVRFKTLKNVETASSLRMNVTEFYDLGLNPISCNGYTTTVNIAFDETYTEDSPAVSVSACYFAEDETVTATVTLEKDSCLGAGDFVLRFDPAVLAYRSYQKEFSPTFFNVNDKDASDGTFKFSIISLNDITDEKTVITVVFDVRRTDEDQLTELNISGSGLTDSLTNPILLNFIDAYVRVPHTGKFTVGGTVTSFGGVMDPITVQLIPSGNTEAAYTGTVVGNSAIYAMEDVIEGEYTLRVSKANHIPYEETLTVAGNDVTKNVSLVLGNNGKQFKINSAYLVLSQDINVIYRTTVPDGFSNPRMVFTFNGKDTTVTEYTVDEEGRYCYAFPGVNPQKIGDNISSTLYATVGGVEVNVSVPTYSVRQYCINQLNKNPDDNLKRMISDLLVYGEKTQIYQNYKTDALVTDGLDLSPSSFVEMDSTYNKQQLIGTEDPNIRYSSARLQLSNNMIVLLGITADDPAPYTFEVTINGRTTVYTSEDLSYRDGGYYLSFSGVKATEFDDVITAVIKKDGVQIGQTLRYSVYTYIQKYQNTEDETLRELIRAIYNYGESAKLYEK